ALPARIDASRLDALAAAAQRVPGVTFVDKAASVSRLFGAYRMDSAIWLAGALLVVGALLSWRYGPRGGVATTLPVAFAIGLTLAVFGYLRMPLTLFNWLALMLVLGVGANYAVFLREGCQREASEAGSVWTGVLLSAATTLLSFGMLGASGMPALRAFGSTLALGIVFSVLFAPLAVPRHQDSRPCCFLLFISIPSSLSSLFSLSFPSSTPLNFCHHSLSRFPSSASFSFPSSFSSFSFSPFSP
ncbi:MMPL family transporter, partial [Burkholderia sp. Ac-20379]|nr:MMPL family transporter [Burkholderia sp. Ac-20379]